MLYTNASELSDSFVQTLDSKFNVDSPKLLSQIPETFFQFADFRVLSQCLSSVPHGSTPVLIAPLSAPRAQAVANEILLCKRNCILILPAIFRCRYYIHLKRCFPSVQLPYKSIFPRVSYCGFDAIAYFRNASGETCAKQEES